MNRLISIFQTAVFILVQRLRKSCILPRIIHVFWISSMMRRRSCSVFRFMSYVPDDAAIESIRDFVERCYRLILGRESDEAGLNNWVNALLFNTADASQIISGFMNSEEFGNQQKDNSETVEILYNTMLNRPSDTAGKEYWVDAIWLQRLMRKSGSFMSTIPSFPIS